MLRSRCRPLVERLEDRTCPALNVNQFGGWLIISGSATSNATISVTQNATTAGTFTVTDGTFTHAPFTGVRHIKFLLTSANDTVDLNLGGNTFAGSVYAYLGRGTNALTARNGTLAYLNVYGGRGTDTVALGDGTTTFRATRSVYVNLDGSPADALTLANHATVSGSLSTAYVNTVNLNAGSEVGRSAIFYGGTAGNTVTVRGAVDRDVIFVSAGWRTTGKNTLTIAAGATVGRDVRFTSSRINAVGHQVDINGTVNRDVTVHGSEKNDTVNVGAAARITRDLAVYLGRGNDTATVAGGSTIGRTATFLLDGGADTLTFGAIVGNDSGGPAFHVDTGAGNDQVEIASAAVFKGTGRARMGDGDDTFRFAAAFTFNTYDFTIAGGGNTSVGDTLLLTGTTGTKLSHSGFEHVTP